MIFIATCVVVVTERPILCTDVVLVLVVMMKVSSLHERYEDLNNGSSGRFYLSTWTTLTTRQIVLLLLTWK